MSDRSTSRVERKKAHPLREARPLKVVSRYGSAAGLGLSSRTSQKQATLGSRGRRRVPTLRNKFTARISRFRASPSQ
jgi:hypothetical protein